MQQRQQQHSSAPQGATWAERVKGVTNQQQHQQQHQRPRVVNEQAFSLINGDNNEGSTTLFVW